MFAVKGPPVELGSQHKYKLAQCLLYKETSMSWLKNVVS